MVSTVTAKKRADAGVADILRALFPCGSVTGAPKIRAMEILRALEASPRGAYCGALGFFASGWFGQLQCRYSHPDDHGGAGRDGHRRRRGAGFARPVRNMPSACSRRASLKLGRKPLELIETLRWENGFVRLDPHLARMQASAAMSGPGLRQCRGALCRWTLPSWARHGAQRVRLTLDEAGAHRATAHDVPPNPDHWTYTVSADRNEQLPTPCFATRRPGVTFTMRTTSAGTTRSFFATSAGRSPKARAAMSSSSATAFC